MYEPMCFVVNSLRFLSIRVTVSLVRKGRDFDHWKGITGLGSQEKILKLKVGVVSGCL